MCDNDNSRQKHTRCTFTEHIKLYRTVVGLPSPRTRIVMDDLASPELLMVGGYRKPRGSIIPLPVEMTDALPQRVAAANNQRQDSKNGKY